MERVRNDDEVESFKHCMNEASHQVIEVYRFSYIELHFDIALC